MNTPGCSTMVWQTGYYKSACSRAGVIVRDGKFYCKQHDPVAKREKEDARRARTAQQAKLLTATRDANTALRRAEAEVVEAAKRFFDGWGGARLLDAVSAVRDAERDAETAKLAYQQFITPE